jgi:hypothetical protein
MAGSYEDSCARASIRLSFFLSFIFSNISCSYCFAICMSYLAASIADACAYTMFRMAGDALACRLRRRLLHCTMHRDLHELAQVRARAAVCLMSLQL